MIQTRNRDNSKVKKTITLKYLNKPIELDLSFMFGFNTILIESPIIMFNP